MTSTWKIVSMNTFAELFYDLPVADFWQDPIVHFYVQQIDTLVVSLKNLHIASNKDLLISMWTTAQFLLYFIFLVVEKSYVLEKNSCFPLCSIHGYIKFQNSTIVFFLLLMSKNVKKNWEIRFWRICWWWTCLQINSSRVWDLKFYLLL